MTRLLSLLKYFKNDKLTYDYCDGTRYLIVVNGTINDEIITKYTCSKCHNNKQHELDINIPICVISYNTDDNEITSSYTVNCMDGIVDFYHDMLFEINLEMMCDYCIELKFNNPDYICYLCFLENHNWKNIKKCLPYN